jgi:hypothetical protein
MTVEESKEQLEQAKEEIKRRVSCKGYLKKAKHGGYVCPFCGSGTGKEGTGALKYYESTNTWVCHSEACKQANGKHRTGDVVDLHQQETGADY